MCTHIRGQESLTEALKIPFCFDELIKPFPLPILTSLVLTVSIHVISSPSKMVTADQETSPRASHDRNVHRNNQHMIT